jgi:hypothetical protein
MHHLLFVDDRPCSARRPCSLNDALLVRSDVRPILLRAKGEPLDPDYLIRTSAFDQYYVDTHRPVVEQAPGFIRWCEAQGLRPTSFCCMSEPRQEYWQAFARAVGLPGLPAEVARALRHKPTMKSWLQRAGLRTAAYAEVASSADVEAFAEEHGYPVVLKPVDGWGALATVILNNADEVGNRLVEDQAWAMMVETYIGDEEYECCALVADGKVLDVFPSIMPARPVDAAQGAINANISIGPRQPFNPVPDLKAVVQTIVTAFGLERGYLHMELFASAGGERLAIGELALRYPGCEIAKNHGLAYGFDIANATIDTYLGLVPMLAYTGANCVGDLLLPYTAGWVQRVSTAEDLLQLPGVIQAHIGVAPGEWLAEVETASFNCSGWVFVEGNDPQEVATRMMVVRDFYVLETILTPAAGDC